MLLAEGFWPQEAGLSAVHAQGGSRMHQPSQVVRDAHSGWPVLVLYSHTPKPLLGHSQLPPRSPR